MPQGGILGPETPSSNTHFVKYRAWWLQKIRFTGIVSVSLVLVYRFCAVVSLNNPGTDLSAVLDALVELSTYLASRFQLH